MELWHTLECLETHAEDMNLWKVVSVFPRPREGWSGHFWLTLGLPIPHVFFCKSHGFFCKVNLLNDIMRKAGSCGFEVPGLIFLAIYGCLLFG